MAKIRVYELARELKMESKELVEALNAGGLDIKNYMSTLDEGMASKARKVISGAISEVVVEKRVKPRVIRRRKKMVQVEEKDELTGEADGPPTDEIPETIQGTPDMEKAPPSVSMAAEPEKIKSPVTDDDAQAPVEIVVDAPIVPEEDSPAQEPEAHVETVEVAPPEVPEAQAPAEIVVPVQEPAVLDKKSPAPDKRAKTKGKKGKKRKSDRPAKNYQPAGRGSA
jgi:translation initiation factor IF-2